MSLLSWEPESLVGGKLKYSWYELADQHDGLREGSRKQHDNNASSFLYVFFCLFVCLRFFQQMHGWYVCGRVHRPTGILFGFYVKMMEKVIIAAFAGLSAFFFKSLFSFDYWKKIIIHELCDGKIRALVTNDEIRKSGKCIFNISKFWNSNISM